MTTHVITHWSERITSMTTSISAMRYLNEIMFILKVLIFRFKGPYDKQNLTLMVISYEIYEMTTSVRSSFYGSCEYSDGKGKNQLLLFA